VLKRSLVLTAVIAAFAAVALIPVSASADTFLKCPPGATNLSYCSKVVLCVVPRLSGKTVHAASQLLRRHNCTLGKVRRVRGHKKGKIFASHPSHGSILARNARVGVSIGTGRRRRH
jgi:hypothetical protein